MTVGALLAALLLSAGAGNIEDERADIEERLEAERQALDSLRGSKKDVLGLLEAVEQLSRVSSARVAQLEKASARLKVQVAAAQAEETAAQEALAAQEAQVAPRLFSLYRLGRREKADWLMSSTDFATLVKRDRAMRTVVERDVQTLDAMAVMARYQARQAARLDRLQHTMLAWSKALRVEQGVAAERKRRFNELVATLSAEASQKTRVIAELERADRELTDMVSEMKTAPGVSGFRARKGFLPMPTQGLVEVGFGRVVNPRFNTVTVQKGIDIRAAVGTPVLSIGPGTVSFSGWLKGYGNLLIIDHGDGYHSLMAHLAHSKVEVGNEVEEGEEVAVVGDTGSLKGPYLYFEIRKQGQAIDPLPWFDPKQER
ncbi:MAG: peptidoglycan DD-metalloendopeptidase family protein [Myxococcaceae bacterium]|nr:peptidoglycan DD-metalloendopeptidase family protein [Myxococcaceae bacterium]